MLSHEEGKNQTIYILSQHVGLQLLKILSIQYYVIKGKIQLPVIGKSNNFGRSYQSKYCLARLVRSFDGTSTELESLVVETLWFQLQT
jgi:hypothetical protein